MYSNLPIPDLAPFSISSRYFNFGVGKYFYGFAGSSSWQCKLSILLNPVQQKHLYSIDMLRGWVALLVCLYHFTGGFFPEGHALRHFFSRGYLGVEVFFVISGLVIPMAMERMQYTGSLAGNFLLRRLLRIEPPYWCSIALIFVADFFAKFSRHYADKRIDWDAGQLISHLFHMNDLFDIPWYKGVYWSLAIEVQYYLLMALVFPLIRHGKLWLSWFVLFVFCMGRWLDADMWVWYYGCHFATGTVLYYHSAGHINGKWTTAMLGVCFVLTYWCFDVYHLTAVVLSSIFIVAIRMEFQPLVFLGKLSYSFYLIHVQVGWFAMDLLIRSYPDGNRTFFLALSIALTLAASQVFYQYIERPSHRWSQRLASHRKPHRTNTGPVASA